MNKFITSVLQSYPKAWGDTSVTPHTLKINKEEFGTTIVTVLRNNLNRMPTFLKHYRELGIKKFVFIDNDSTDNTVEYLGSQPDVDIYITQDSFSSINKQIWLHKVILEYGYNKWYLVLDPDEHLVYDGMDKYLIEDLVTLASKENVKRLLGLLIDMYADGGTAVYDDINSNQQLITSCCFFDCEGYTTKIEKTRISIIGGVRKRINEQFNPTIDNPQLAKYPLFLFENDDIFVSPHYAYPFSGNMFSECVLGLLHYKIASPNFLNLQDTLQRMNIKTVAENLEIYTQWYENNKDNNLVCSSSRMYKTVNDLIDCNLIAKIYWESTTSKINALNVSKFLYLFNSSKRRRFISYKKNLHRELKRAKNGTKPTVYTTTK